MKTGSSMIATHKQSSSSLQKKQTETILDKIDKSSQDIKQQITKEAIEMSKKESKIQNLQNTLKSLNKNKAELTKGASPSG